MFQCTGEIWKYHSACPINYAPRIFSACKDEPPTPDHVTSTYDPDAAAGNVYQEGFEIE